VELDLHIVSEVALGADIFHSPQLNPQERAQLKPAWAFWRGGKCLIWNTQQTFPFRSSLFRHAQMYITKNYVTL